MTKINKVSYIYVETEINCDEYVGKLNVVGRGVDINSDLTKYVLLGMFRASCMHTSGNLREICTEEVVKAIQSSGNAEAIDKYNELVQENTEEEDFPTAWMLILDFAQMMDYTGNEQANGITMFEINGEIVSDEAELIDFIDQMRLLQQDN